MDAPTQQEMKYFDHVKKRHEEKGCLYALYVYFVLLSFVLCFFSGFVLTSAFIAACLHCFAVAAAMRLASVVWSVAVVLVKKNETLRCVYVNN